MRSLPVRIAVTLIVPIAVYVINRWVSVPGLEPLFAGMPPGMPIGQVSGVFALGVMPAITAYALVELVASLVPKWNRFHHGDPAGRTKLERVARLLAVLFATVQGFASARQIVSIADDPLFGGVRAPSIGIVAATLVAGACVMMAAADWVSRQGIANGYVLLVVGGELVDFVQSVAGGLHHAERVGTLSPIHHLWLGLGIGLALFASVLVLRGANDARVGKSDGGGTPYRRASPFAIHPWLPLPLSSFAPYPIAVSLLALPPLLHVQVFDTMSNTSFLTILFATVAVLASVLARVLHRPNELAEVASRLGVSTSKLENARSRAMPPTLLFFLVLVVASAVAGGSRYARVGVMVFPLLVASTLDVMAALRSYDFVPVWTERRASVVPVVRAVLEAEGIRVETHGLSTLALLQVFAPYAPATLVVPKADHERAEVLLRHVFLGEQKPAAESAAPIAEPTKLSEAARTRRTTGILGVAAALGMAVVAAMPMLEAKKPVVTGPRSELAVVAVDDEDTTFEHLAPDALPAYGEVRWQLVPRGKGRSARSHDVLVVAQAGETPDVVFARAKAWSDKLTMAGDRRIVWEAMEDFDNDTSSPTFLGVRSVVVEGAPILTTADVVGADANVGSDMQSEAYVAVRLSDAAAVRFAEATGAHVDERIAIILDGRVNSVPIVKSRITGGRVSITMGMGGDPHERLQKAKTLAASLGPRP